MNYIRFHFVTKACARFLTFTVEAASTEAPQPFLSRSRSCSCSKENKEGGKEEERKKSSAHLTSIAELSVCVPPRHWYLDEARGAVTRALLRKAYDVIEVPSLQAADEAPLWMARSVPTLVWPESKIMQKKLLVKNAD